MDQTEYSKFVPAWWLPTAHLQTIFPTFFFAQKEFPTRVERFELPDGDYIDGIWTDKPAAPTVILLHGLQGSPRSYYINSLMDNIYHETNWNALALSFRGCGSDKQRMFRQYHGGDTEDIKFILNLVKQRNPDMPVSMVGYSLGGNILLKLFGELKYSNLCETGIAISPPFDIRASSQYMNKGFLGQFYERTFLSDIKHHMTNKYHYPLHPETLETHLNEIQTLADLDSKMTAPSLGFDTVDEYYNDSSSIHYLKHIKKKTLIILALNDPIIDYSTLPTDEELSKHVELEVYPEGGHVGFISGNIKSPEFWVNKRIMAHLSHYLPLGIHELDQE
jgi:hypothetical protein